MKTLLIDYGSGNITSAAKALLAAGFDVVVSGQPQVAPGAELLVLPGQGHFAQVMRAFRSSGFRDRAVEHIAAGRPFLGICVGLQLLLEGSAEASAVSGLGLLPGRSERFSQGKVPHMGWNIVDINAQSPLLGGHSAYYYFVHSYFVPPMPGSVGQTEYAGTSFTSLFIRQNVVATQFHPEKSGLVGLRFLLALRDYFKSSS